MRQKNSRSDVSDLEGLIVIIIKYSFYSIIFTIEMVLFMPDLAAYLLAVAKLRQPTSTPYLGPQPVYFLHSPAVAQEFVGIALYLKFYILFLGVSAHIGNRYASNFMNYTFDKFRELFYFHSLTFNISHCKNKHMVYHFLLHPVRIYYFRLFFIQLLPNDHL